MVAEIDTKKQIESVIHDHQMMPIEEAFPAESGSPIHQYSSPKNLVSKEVRRFNAKQLFLQKINTSKRSEGNTFDETLDLMDDS